MSAISENINNSTLHVCSAIITSNDNMWSEGRRPSTTNFIAEEVWKAPCQNAKQKPKPKNNKKIQSSVSESALSIITPSRIENARGNVTLPLESPPSGGDLNRQRCNTDMAETEAETELAPLSIPSPNTLKYLFRAHIPIDYLYDVLEKICVKKEKYYIIDFNSYRLLQFHDLYTDFAERIIQAYKPSKQKYVSRTLTYNSFVTIVRHICRINGIPFDTKFNYQYSLYNIDYYIYFTYHPTPSLFPPLLNR